jgi:hypothetical protein
MVSDGLGDGDLPLDGEEVAHGQYSLTLWMPAPKRAEAGYSPTRTITTAFEILPPVRVVSAAAREAVHLVPDDVGRTVSTPQGQTRA